MGEQLAFGVADGAHGQFHLDVGAGGELAVVDHAAVGVLGHQGEAGADAEPFEAGEGIRFLAEGDHLVFQFLDAGGELGAVRGRRRGLRETLFEFGVALLQAGQALLHLLEQGGDVGRFAGQHRGCGQGKHQGQNAQGGVGAGTTLCSGKHGLLPSVNTVIAGWLPGRRPPGSLAGNLCAARLLGQDQLAVAGQSQLVPLAGMFDQQNLPIPQQI